MTKQFDYVDAEGVAFSVEVDFNMTGYAEHTFRKMKLTPTAAQDLADSLIGAIEWTKHPLYQWAVKKTENRV